MTRYDSWAFKVFLCSTLFIVIFSIAAIHNWPPLFKHSSILLACILPAGMVILRLAPTWWGAKQLPKEVLWVLLAFVLALISSLLSENPWATLKSTVLFMASGPFIFITTMYLFQSIKNQEVFLRLNVLVMLTIGFYGIYEYHNSWQILLFSDNPLPAGALLLLLSSCPLILLDRENSLSLKLASALSLILAVLLIILLAKKGPILAMIFVSLFLVFTINLKHLKFFFGIIFLAGIILYFSDPMRSNFKDAIGLKTPASPEAKATASSTGETFPPTSTPSEYQFEFSSTASVRIRMENYFFALHVFKNNPIWGVGFSANLVPYLADYKQKFVHTLGPLRYRQHLESEKTFENMVVAFLIELGGLFTVTYFGGLVYILSMCFKKLRVLPQQLTSNMVIMSVIFGFVFLSLTFDTLRFPNLNWMFHSLLGLMVNLVTNRSSESIESISN